MRSAASVVGAILNLINQGDALFGEGHLNLTKTILTFAVPYCGAVSYRMSGSYSGSVSQIASRSAD